MPDETSIVQTGPNFFRNEIILLLITCITLLVIGEIFFRFYYWETGKHAASDQNELCLKEMKLENLPTSSNGNFVNFKRTGPWDDDELIGVVPKKNHNQNTVAQVITQNNERKSFVLYTAQHHNSQGLTNIEEFSFKKPDNVSIRITLFGDSFACGDEGPLLFNIGYIIKELIPKSEVLNFCVSGRGIEAMYARYFIEAVKFQPDVAVFFVLMDDLQRAFGCPLLLPNITVSEGNVVIGPRQYPTLYDFYHNYTPLKYESYLVKHILWTYNQHTEYKRNMQKGSALFNLMIDNLNNQTKEVNTTLIIVPILWEKPNNVEIEIYDRIIDMLKEKKILHFDSKQYFASQKKPYRNQSFYYMEDKDQFGHLSPIGNALFAQKIKNILETNNLVPPTADYYFANFNKADLLYFIPKNQTIKSDMRAILPFTFTEANYSQKAVLNVPSIFKKELGDKNIQALINCLRHLPFG